MHLNSHSTSQDSPSIPIRSSRLSALFLACTDTWVLGVITLMLFTLGMTIYRLFFDMHPNPPGAANRLLLLTAGIWIIVGLSVAPRFLSSYAIARRGFYVLGRVVNNEVFGIAPRHHSISLNVAYTCGGIAYIAKASVLGKIPDSGSDILVAIHPTKPNQYRVLPYDHRLSKWSRNVIVDKIKALQTSSANAP